MKKILITILFIVLFFEIKAQSGVAFLTQQFNSYQASLPKTKLHLVFNQEKFSPGDTAYFKAYFLMDDLRGVPGRQLIELNLVNSKGDSELHISFRVFNGIGQNQIAIPPMMPAGIYLITAHSNWMKNFDPLPFFRKEIIIARKNTVAPKTKPLVKVAVEGGHLITGIASKVIVNTSLAGTPIKIIDAAGQEINHATADENGICSFTFKPISKVPYFISVADDSVKTLLPTVENDGCSLQLKQNGQEALSVIVTSPPGSPFRREELLIIVSSKKKICYTSSFLQGSKDFVEVQLPQSDLPEGRAHISLLKSDGHLIASRDFYRSTGESVQAKIKTSKSNFQAREKVTAEISLYDSQGNPIEGEFSIKAINAGLFDEGGRNSLADEFNILSGSEEKYLVDHSDPNWLANLDNYLIADTKAVPWKEILLTTTPKPRFTFSNFIQKTGKAYYAETHLPVPDEADIMFYLQQNKIRYQTRVENGKVWLALPDLFGTDELFYFGETFYYIRGDRHGEAIPDLKIEWDNETIQLPNASASKETNHSDRYASYANKRRLIERSYGFFTSAAGSETENILTDDGRIFDAETNGVDITINVQNYFIFPTMAELVKEVIPSLQYRKSKGKDIVFVSLSESMSAMATGDPLYLIDGIATKNTEFFLSLKPIDLLIVKVINDPNKLLRFGLLGKNGIVIVKTKNGDAREPLDDPSKLIEGLNRPVNFKVVDHAIIKHPRRPDFRSTLHWNPSVKTDSNGKATIEFYCSDDTGPISIRVEGLAKGERPFSAEDKIEVVNPKKK